MYLNDYPAEIQSPPNFNDSDITKNKREQYLKPEISKQ
jgi:hypothetical protein